MKGRDATMSLLGHSAQAYCRLGSVCEPKMKTKLCIALLSGLFAGAASGAGEMPPLKVRQVEFTPTPAPSNAQEMTTPYTRSSAIVTLANGEKRTFPLSYNILHRSGEQIHGWPAALVVDRQGKPLLNTAPDTKGQVARGPFYSAGADGTSLLAIPGAKVAGVAGTPLFLVNHLEYQTEGENIEAGKPPVELYGQLPMAMNLTVLEQNRRDGKLTPARIANIDFSGTEGLWIPCNGSTTPWQTHLGSEEYEPDARHFETKPLAAMNAYLGTPGKLASEGGANAYHYGHIVEVKVKRDGSTQAIKHYAMGRLAFELGDVMADRRTVYFGDDGDDVIRAMFVADKAGDLSSGTLYAAKWHQESGENFGRARLSWLRLGHANDAEIKALITRGIRFSDIWEVASAEAVAAAPEQFAGFRPLYVYPGTGSKPALEYYRLKPGQEKAAAFLETRRYAAWLGATSEFTKMEGIAHSVQDRKQWTVISYVRAGMIAGKNGKRPQDDIRLDGDERDLSCGVVYESNLRGGQKDSQGQPIASQFVAVDMVGKIYGERQPADAQGSYDKCHTDKLANPDNIRYSEAMRTLFIGEDSGNHINNFVWAYNVDKGSVTRLFSAPAGAENTGLNVYDNFNGHTYITANIQHPGAAEDLAKYPEAIRVDLRSKIDQRGVVGYFGGLPGMRR